MTKLPETPQAYAVIQLFDGVQIGIELFPNKNQANTFYDMLMTYPESRAPLCDSVRLAAFHGDWVER